MIENVMLWIVGIVIASILAILGYVVYDDMTSDHITLKKGDWTCSVHGTVTTLIPQQIGKTTVLMPYTSDECHRYERIAK